jgi:subfamily B ATP-binding cassette protein MsbA
MFNVLKLMFPYIRPFWKQALLAVSLSLPLAGLKAYQAYLVKDIFDKGFQPDSPFQEAINLALILVGLGILNYPLRYFHYFNLKRIVDLSTARLRLEIYRKFQRLPVGYYAQKKQGTLISTAMNDTGVFSEAFKSSMEIIREPLTAIALLGVAFYHDWRLTLVIFGVAPLFILTFHFTGKRIRRYVGKSQKDFGEMTHVVGEALSGQKIIKAFGLQDYIFTRFVKLQDSYLFNRLKSTSADEHSHPLVELVGSIAFAGVIVYAHHRISTGALTTGGFISFVAALAMFMEPIRQFSKSNAKLNQAKAAAIRIFGLLEVEEEKEFDKKEFPGLKHQIEFRNVSFSYGEGMVVKNLNLTIKKGEKIGLVGLSGSGKSTLVSLLLRLYPVTDGEILLDGENMNNFSLESMRKVFALVSQDIFLFNDSVKENLTTGDLHTDEEIKHALEISYAWEFVKDLPQGIETPIGDKGLRLSGGQSQRLTIARAFLKNRDVMLFDEATSALDNESEKIVQAALERVAGHKTVIAVAHRLSTLKDFDRIVVMKDGQNIEEGTHSELIAKSGEYKKLFELSQRD